MSNKRAIIFGQRSCSQYDTKIHSCVHTCTTSSNTGRNHVRQRSCAEYDAGTYIRTYTTAYLNTGRNHFRRCSRAESEYTRA